MPIFDIYSKRHNQLETRSQDVYRYDDLPRRFRAQVIYILKDVFGAHEINPYSTSYQTWCFKKIHDALAREYGLLQLDKNAAHVLDSVFNFFLSADTERALDTIELSFSLAELIGSDELKQKIGFGTHVVPVEDALNELNARFLEHGLGYQYESRQIIRIDSEFLHAKALRPALHLLRGTGFSGAETEFLEAHKRYKQQQYEDAIIYSAKALESTLKVICVKKKWSFSKNDTAKHLISVIFEHGLIPNYLQSEFGGLRAILEGGVPTIRNKTSSHGRGEESRHVPGYLVGYVLHLTAATIVFLIKASKE